MTKLRKAQERFTAALTDYVRREGAEVDDRYFYDYVLETPLGPLQISVHDTWIATCFVASKTARKIVNAWWPDDVGYTGKWNFHFGRDPVSLDPEHCICHFGYHLGKVLFYEPSRQERADIAAEVAAFHQKNEQYKQWSLNQ